MSVSYEIGPLFNVMISGDRELVTMFLGWALANGIRSVGGAEGESCAGHLDEFYDMKHAARIREWFDTNTSIQLPRTREQILEDRVKLLESALKFKTPHTVILQMLEVHKTDHGE